MNRLKFAIGFLAVGAACSATAQVLQFTNITLSTSPNLFHGLTNQLNSVVYGGNSNFVAVGANQIYVCGNFQPGQSWLTKSDWVTNQILPAHGLNLASVATGGNLFVATGDSNVVYSAANNFASGLAWSQKDYIFGNGVPAPGIAYNGNGFAAVATAPEIGWSTTNLTTTNNWALGTLANIDFAESFRGITGYGANGFAACGLFADIRLSSNGTNWQAAVNGQFGEPDLYGMAYDGVRTFVAVGATNSSSSDNGIILASTNNAGTNWLTVFVNAASASPINAVTYNGSRFVAVGTAGQVLTSTNGINWVVQTNTATSTNLYGVAFANSGYMAGIGELVGSAGTVILAGLPPPALTNGINATNCASYPITPPQNDALTAIATTNANFPPGSVGANWFDAQGDLVTNATPTFYPTNNPNLVGSNTPVSYTYYAEEVDLRTGFVNTNLFPVTLQINPRPTATLTPLITTDCNLGDSFTLTNTLTGIGPWTVTWNDGTVQTANGSGPVILTRTVDPTNFFANIASNNVYYVTAVSNADMCLGNVPGDIIGTNVITINPLPTATLTPFSATNCNEGAPYIMTNTLTGIGPWTLYWNDGTVQPVPQAGSGPFVSLRTVYPTNSVGANVVSNNVYYVTVVSNADMCTGNQPGAITGTNNVVINPRPTATLVPLNTTDCNLGDSFILTNVLTGIGPWTVYWNDGTVQTANGSGPVILARTVDPTNFFANIASNNVYYVTAVSNADMCIGNQPGDLIGTDTITINPRPTSSLMPLSTTNCNEGTPYTLTNTLTGIGPWTLYWNDGTVQPVSQAGSGPFVSTRTVYPTNSIGANVVSNNIYFVTVVSNTDMCTGNLPGDVIGTNNVVIDPRPTARLTALNISDCNLGDSYILTNTLTGIGPWTIYWNDGTTQTANGSGPVVLARTVYPTNFFANIASNNVYFVTAVSNADMCIANQPGDLIGTNTLTINPLPTATLTPFSATNCNEGTPYIMTNTLTGIGPWTLYWNDGTVQPVPQAGSGPFVSTRTVYPTNSIGANVVSNNVYYVTVVSNTDMCTGNQPGAITGTNNVVINPRPTATLMTFNTTNCNEGTFYTLTNTLTGIGPWTIYWNDGTIQTTNATGPVILLRTVYPTNSIGANAASNNVYYVTVVTNADMCIGNQPGDIIGTNKIVINPLPTSSLIPFSTTNCNDGTSYTLTNTLTGVGPWTVYWNDGSIQTTNGSGPLALIRTVYPTNSVGANAASNNVYYVTVVTNADMCIGNQPGDIVGTNLIVINPRPTAMLTTLVTNICNLGSSFTLTATLTGIGPWTNYWNDGTIQVTNGAGPLTLIRTVFPTNTLTAAPFTNIYYISNLVNSDACIGNQPGDVTGTNLIVVNPLPAATLTISTNDFAVTTNGIGTGLLEAVSNPSGSTYNLTVGFQYLQNGTPHNIGTQTLNVTNHLAFGGMGPWTIILSDGSKTYTNTFASAGSYVWQETISTNTDTNFTFTVQSVQNTNSSCSQTSTNVYDVLVYDAPTALVDNTNIVFCGSATNIATISATLGGFGPWTNVVWSDGFTNSLVTSNPLNRTVPTPTNDTLVQIVTNYTIVSLTDMYGTATTSSNDLTGSTAVIVDPYTNGPPGIQTSVNYSCDTIPVLLSVNVPNGFTAEWFDANTNLLTNGVTSYLQSAPGTPATNVYLVAAIYNDTNLNDGCYSPFAAITNIFADCTNEISSLSLNGTNVVISWNGNFILQGTTNLLPPTMWMNIYTGALGPNFLTNEVSQPPNEFFRLYAPTN